MYFSTRVLSIYWKEFIAVMVSIYLVFFFIVSIAELITFPLETMIYISALFILFIILVVSLKVFG